MFKLLKLKHNHVRGRIMNSHKQLPEHNNLETNNQQPQRHALNIPHLVSLYPQLQQVAGFQNLLATAAPASTLPSIQINIHNSQFYFQTPTQANNNQNSTTFPQHTPAVDNSVNNNNNNGSAATPMHVTTNTARKRRTTLLDPEANTKRASKHRFAYSSQEQAIENTTPTLPTTVWVVPNTAQVIDAAAKNFDDLEKEEISICTFMERKKMWLLPTIVNRSRKFNTLSASEHFYTIYKLITEEFARKLLTEANNEPELDNTPISPAEYSLAELQTMGLHIVHRKTQCAIPITEIDKYTVDQLNINKNITLNSNEKKIKFNKLSGEIYDVNDPTIELSKYVVIISKRRAYKYRYDHIKEIKVFKGTLDAVTPEYLSEHPELEYETLTKEEFVNRKQAQKHNQTATAPSNNSNTQPLPVPALPPISVLLESAVPLTSARSFGLPANFFSANRSTGTHDRNSNLSTNTNFPPI